MGYYRKHACYCDNFSSYVFLPFQRTCMVDVLITRMFDMCIT